MERRWRSAARAERRALPANPNSETKDHGCHGCHGCRKTGLVTRWLHFFRGVRTKPVPSVFSVKSVVSTSVFGLKIVLKVFHFPPMAGMTKGNI
jgi:hypothetical protein